MNRIILIGVGVLALVGVVLGALSFSKVSDVDSRLSVMEKAYGTATATVTIDYSGVKEKESHELVLPSGTTAWEALNRVAKVNGVEGEAEGEEEPPMYLELNGVSKLSHNGKDRDWQFYTNGMNVPLGLAAQFPVQDGDNIMFKYEEAATESAEEEGGLSIEGGESPAAP